MLQRINTPYIQLYTNIHKTEGNEYATGTQNKFSHIKTLPKINLDLL